MGFKAKNRAEKCNFFSPVFAFPLKYMEGPSDLPFSFFFSLFRLMNYAKIDTKI
jgi:hypothetical protein